MHIRINLVVNIRDFHIYSLLFVTATVISPLKIQLSSGEYRTMESSGMVCIDVMADRQASEPFSISLMPLGRLYSQSASGKAL